MSTKGCRRCLTNQSQLTVAKDEVRRVAVRMSKASRPSRMESLKTELVIAKANVIQAQGLIDRGHDCDTRLVDEHWTKAQRA